MGTGLGPRSYAIIEQGMVSRLVDAKPEEMRSYIEEAAGISKYKERRRETETRMHHRRGDLARLADLRDEVEKQIKHLQRQAHVAEIPDAEAAVPPARSRTGRINSLSGSRSHPTGPIDAITTRNPRLPAIGMWT